MKIAVLLPSYGPVYRKHERCLRTLFNEHPDWISLERTGPNLDISRALLAERAIKEGIDIALCIDSDMTFNVSTCENIIRQAFELKAIVGCIYLGKTNGNKLPQVVLKESITCFKGGKLIEVEAIGLGLVAIPVNMLERIADVLALSRQKVGPNTFARPWFTNDGRWESMHTDDFAFCRRVRKAGIKIFADTRERVGHLGEYEYHLEDMRGREFFDTLEIEK